MSDDARLSFTGGYREDRDERGAPRPGYAQLLEALEATDLEQLRDAVARRLEAGGVRFGAGAFVVDPVPRLICAAEWDRLAAGLEQRARALNHFLRDVYGERRIVAAGLLGADTILHAQGYEADLEGRLPGGGEPAAIVGFDLVRDVNGEFLVLEDNLRTPSGFAYAAAARQALLAALPAGCPVPRPIEERTYELLAAVLRRAAPAGADRLSIVVLTDGPGNVAHYEHARVAARLGVPLATLADLVGDGDRLLVRLADGTMRPVDVVYRRTDDDRVRDEAGELTAVARVLLRPWLAGRVGLVNAFGNGVADDKLVHAHVEEFVRFYLGEEPLVRSVPTATLDDPSAQRDATTRMRELVVKPRHGHGGVGVVIGAHADAEDLDRLAAEIKREPRRYVYQPMIPLSLHPTVVEGRLEPRHVDLRPFAFAADEVALIPGGLTRVAFEANALVVNSSQNGGGKDTWVID